MIDNKPIGQCAKCKRDLFKMDMYCCPDPECPAQLKSWLNSAVNN